MTEAEGIAQEHGCKLLRLIGNGSFGKVYAVEKIENNPGKHVTVMKITTGKRYQKEGPIHKMLCMGDGCENIIKIFSQKEYANNFVFFMEYARNGCLEECIPLQSKTTVHNYFRQLTSAVEYIHSKRVCHRDIKPSNLLLSHQGVLKLCDFGLAEYWQYENGKEKLLKKKRGSLNYMSPEAISVINMRGRQIDLWAVGSVLVRMMVGDMPWLQASISDSEFRLFSEGKLDVMKFEWDDLGDALDLVLRLLDWKPDSRATIKEVREHPWFQNGPAKKHDAQVVEDGKEESGKLE